MADEPKLSKTVTELLKEINKYRKAAGLPPIGRSQVPEGFGRLEFLNEQLNQAKEQWKGSLPFWQRQLADIGAYDLTEGQAPAPSFAPSTEQLGPSAGLDVDEEDPFAEQRRLADAMGIPLDEYLRQISGISTGISDFQRAQLDQSNRDRDIQVQQINFANRQAFQERVGTRTWQQMLSDTASLQASQRPFEAEALNINAQDVLRQQFEGGRPGEGAGGAPRDWINRFIAQNQPNPFNQQLGPSGLDDAARALQASQTANRGLVGRTFADPFTGETSFGDPSPVAGFDTRQLALASQLNQRIEELQQELASTKAQAEALNFVTNPDLVDKTGKSVWGNLTPEKRQQMQALGDSVRGGEGGGGERDVDVEARRRSKALEVGASVPQQLQQFIGGRTNLPQGLKGNINVTTPSGQQWNRLGSTQRQQFAGLVDFAGNRSFADVLDQMVTMQPGTPSGARRAKVRFFF